MTREEFMRLVQDAEGARQKLIAAALEYGHDINPFSRRTIWRSKDGLLELWFRLAREGDVFFGFAGVIEDDGQAFREDAVGAPIIELPAVIDVLTKLHRWAANETPDMPAYPDDD
jgi:hypothetical protein